MKLLSLLSQQLGSQLNHPFGLMEVFTALQRLPFRGPTPAAPAPRSMGSQVLVLPLVTQPSVRPTQENISECILYLEIGKQGEIVLVAESLEPSAKMSAACHLLVQHFVSAINTNALAAAAPGQVPILTQTIGKSLLAAVEIYDLPSHACQLLASSPWSLLVTVTCIQLLINSLF